jgi:hypothetical protein
LAIDQLDRALNGPFQHGLSAAEQAMLLGGNGNGSAATNLNLPELDPFELEAPVF